ncbi:MAG: phosphatidate cytidylyltransferase [Ignavibacteriales bacterium]|nr:phosphatidate cytidylyltransferase [Ignavibacteriales bacterium]
MKNTNNTLIRIFVSVIAIPVIVAAGYFGKFYFLSFIILIACVSFFEFSRLSSRKDIFVNFFIGEISIIAIIFDFYFNYINPIVLLLAIPVLLMFFELWRNKGSALQNIATTIFGIVYLGLFPSTLISIREIYADYNQGGYLILSILFGIWLCDSAAMFLGMLIGKHKIFSRVSPKKSWEGTIAGFILGLSSLLISKLIVLDFLSWVDVIIIGIIVGAFGQIGDFVESLIKRDVAVKDSSNIIPGHGGLMDRFDSLFFVAPLTFIYLNISYILN